jgi:hypothetical protein
MILHSFDFIPKESSLEKTPRMTHLRLIQVSTIYFYYFLNV